MNLYYSPASARKERLHSGKTTNFCRVFFILGCHSSFDENPQQNAFINCHTFTRGDSLVSVDDLRKVLSTTSKFSHGLVLSDSNLKDHQNQGSRLFLRMGGGGGKKILEKVNFL